MLSFPPPEVSTFRAKLTEDCVSGWINARSIITLRVETSPRMIVLLNMVQVRTRPHLRRGMLRMMLHVCVRWVTCFSFILFLKMGSPPAPPSQHLPLLFKIVECFGRRRLVPV